MEVSRCSGGENNPLQGGKQLSSSTTPFIITSVLLRSAHGPSWDNLDLGTNMFFLCKGGTNMWGFFCVSSHP